MSYTADTPNGGITGEVAFLETGTAHSLSAPGLRGKIGLLLGSLNLNSPAYRKKLIGIGLKGLIVIDARTQYREPMSVGAAPQWLLDFTLPMTSLLKGARITELIDSQALSWDIEDLWIPFFCISTNLSRGLSPANHLSWMRRFSCSE